MSRSPDTETGRDPAGPGTPTAPDRRRLIAPVASGAIGALAVTVLFAIGAWQRRWIADDGLIVLRTIRNLLAGNGPVFNAGERVEANTSTAWTYLLWFWSWVTGADQTEYVALWVALILSVASIPLAMYGTARLYGRQIVGPGITLLLPLGAIVYIAIPPARDFATSGLENGLVLFWIAGLWCMFLAWGRRRPHKDPTQKDPTQKDPAHKDPAQDDADGRGGAGVGSGRRETLAFYALVFVAGLAPLIRPEITILGGLVLLVLFCSPIGWRRRVAMVAVAGALPVGYQIFRMGYYAVLVPNPAIAKDASGSKWSQGAAYLDNLYTPYTLLLPTIVVIVAGILLAAVTVVGRRRAAGERAGADRKGSAGDEWPEILDPEPAAAGGAVAAVTSGWRRFSARLQSTDTVVVTVVVAGLVLGLYWLRQGGDFMHGRVLLAPIFILLLPVMAIPVRIPSTLRDARRRRQLAASIALVGGWVTVVWWGVAAHDTVLPNAGMDIGRDGIVDERRFYVTNMGNENPVTAEDYRDYPRMRAMVEAIADRQGQGGILLPSANYDEWYVSPLPKKMPPGAPRETTVYFLNLGMTSMNAPLDVRVVDQMGLAYPLAAHTARLTDGRIGHDKNLPSFWVVAESGGSNAVPGFIDRDELTMARVALTCPATQDRFASYKGTWTFARFRHNLRQSFGFNSYRISRVPEYEIARCGLPMPAGLGEK
ncbi:hypothetical protein [Gordonia shandongensis]|uniref:hypothetical protein n=1 Tax=Gordonia shandongensis TaxID=376351 RepID=UPI000557B4E6|nr:hypothetical protein [Gordonia shandongensis]